jgi:hypothetical protein
MPAIESLPIPQNINAIVLPGTNTSDPAMVTCCAPNRVQIVDGCYLWCEIPASYLDGTDDAGARSATSSCLEEHGRNYKESRITGWQFNAGTRAGAGSAKQLGLWALALSGVVYAVL